MKKVLISSVLGLSLVVGLTGCGQSDEEKIKELLKKGKPTSTIGWHNPSIRINNQDTYCPKILNSDNYDEQKLQVSIKEILEDFPFNDHFYARDDKKSMFSNKNCNYNIYKK